MALDGDKAIGITQAVVLGFRCGLVLFLLPDVPPNLIALDLLHGHIHDQPAHERGALLASLDQKPQDRITMQSSDALSRADAGPLNEQLERESGLLGRNAHDA